VKDPNVIRGAVERDILSHWPGGPSEVYREAIPWEQIVPLLVELIPLLFTGCTRNAISIRQSIEIDPVGSAYRVWDRAYPLAHREVASDYSWFGRVFHRGEIRDRAEQLADRISLATIDAALHAPPERFVAVAVATGEVEL